MRRQSSTAVHHVGAAIGAGGGHGQRVARHHAVEHGIACVQGRCVGAVVHLVVGGNACDGDGFGRDGAVAGRQAAARGQAVVGRIGAAQGHVAERVGFVGADVFIGIRACAADGHHVTRDHTNGCARQTGNGGGAVVHLAHGGRGRKELGGHRL